MDKYKEFRDRLKQFDNQNLVDNLEIDRELLSEMDENDPLKFYFEWRIKLYQAELQIRRYFNESAIEHSTVLSVVEITVDTYINLLQFKSEFDCQSLNEKIINSLNSVNRDEIILCAVKGTEVIIDIKTLMSKEDEFSYENLSYWLDSYIKPDYQRISELPHLFWNYILEESDIFKLFREVGAAFCTFFNEEKIKDNIRAGSDYTTWEEVSSLYEYLQNGTKENKFIDFHILILTHNQETDEPKWYQFTLNSEEITLRLGDVGYWGSLKEPYLFHRILLDYNLLLNNQQICVEEIKKVFVHSFSTLLPTTNINSKIEKEFIHYVNYKFNQLEPKPKYDFTKY
jgi:hypothetical protein